VLLALGMGAWLDVAPLARIELNGRGLAAGVAATAPLLVGLWWCRRTRFAPITRLVTFVEERIAPVFGGCGPAELAVVALAAGVGEELLFRGVLQPALAVHIPPAAAVVAIGLLFGAVHWLTPAYALLAGLVGIYLGALYAVSGNLLAPITAHALYDFVALTLLARVKPTPGTFVL
jgi:membrane protease YdiL (CAAX protease family)